MSEKPMHPLAMIAEWRKGCSHAGPKHSELFPKEEALGCAECISCTEGLIDALEKALPYFLNVPGMQVCDTCNFVLTTSNLNMNAGTVTARHEPTDCPNCKTAMRPLLERELRESNWQDLERLHFQNAQALKLLYQATLTVDRSKRHEINDFLDGVKYVKREEVLYEGVDEPDPYTEH